MMTETLSETKQRILEILRAEPLSGAEVQRRLANRAYTATMKALRSLARDGYVRRIGSGALIRWERILFDLAPPASQLEPGRAPEPPMKPDSRVALAGELLDVERAIEDLLVRRSEILEALR